MEDNKSQIEYTQSLKGHMSFRCLSQVSLCKDALINQVVPLGSPRRRCGTAIKTEFYNGRRQQQT